MKKYCLMALALAALSSCSTMTQTGKTANVESSILSATVADLKVGDRVTAELNVDKSLRRGGMASIRHAVEAEALAKAGNADVLLEPQYVVEKHRGLFSSKVTKIAVSGRPAFYSNFRNFSDTVWTNPTFRGCVGRKLVAAKQRRSVAAGIAPKEQSEYVSRRRGLTGIFNVSAGFSQLHQWYCYDESSEAEIGESQTFNAGVQLSVGWQFNPRFFLGVGAGATYNGGDIDDVYVPWFVQGRYYMSSSNRAPFVDLKVGSTFRHPGFHSAKHRTFVSPSLGYTFGRFEVALQYQLTRGEEDDRSYNKYDGYLNEKLYVHNVNFTFGLRL